MFSLYGFLTGRKKDPQSFRTCVNSVIKGNHHSVLFPHQGTHSVNSITERLEQDGWQRELKDYTTLHMLRAHKSVNQPKALTERSAYNLHRIAVY